MAKMRIHELAKEIDKTSKEVITLLAEKGIEGKAAQSTLEDDQIELVKKAFGGAKKAAAKKTASAEKTDEKAATKTKSTAKAEPKAETKAESKAEASKAEATKAEAVAEEPKAEAPKAEAAKEEAPKKKKTNIIFVSNPHNSRAPGGQRPAQGNNGAQRPNNSQSRPQNAGQQGRNSGASMQGRPAPLVKINVERTASREMEQSRLEQERADRQAAQRKPSDQKAGGSANENASSQSQTNVQTNTTGVQSGNAPTRSYNSSNSGARRDDSRPTGQGGVRQGQSGGRTYSSNQGQGGSRPYNNSQGQGGARPYNNQGQGGSRPYNNQGQGGSRPYNNQGQGGSRPYGNSQGQGGSRPYGNSQGQGGNRPYGNSPGQGQGGRPGAAGGFDSSAKTTVKEQEKHRDEQEKRRQNQDKKRKDQIFTNEDGFKGGKPVKGAKPTKLEKPQEKAIVKEEEKIKVITLPESLTIKELAEKMKIQPSAIVKKLFLQGKVVTVNQEVSYEVAEEIAMEFEVLCEKEIVIDVIEELLKEEEENPEDMTARPPVICVMGHVDHGKTSLLDAIRKTNVIDREAGGITQHIGAYVVTINGQKITFLDTPGHEAFTAMRMRGANATDIAILVVAADDGVMPQTVEAINHAKAAGIEIIVAVNKIDKPSANIDRVKQELAEYELIPEDWGGSTVFAPVSAKSGEGIEQMLEMILLTADILELKSNAKRKARGLVIEAQLDKGRGPVATVLVQKGTLKIGDFIAAGSCHGKVRAMIDDKGRRVKEAGPSTPVEILGLGDVPNAGDIFVAPENDKEARSFAETFISQNRVKLLDDTKAKMLSLDDLFTQIQAGNLKELNIIIKADVQGSVEAVKESLLKLSNEEVVVKVIHGGVGAINESDVILASASNAIIIGFNVRPDATAKTTAETEGVDVRLYSVIYKAIEDVEAAMKGMLDPVFEEKVLGHAEIRQIFKASGIGNISGSYVLDGLFQRGCSVRISREGEQIFEGKLASLKRFKDDAKEVKAGFECGLVFEGFDAVQELDVVEAYTMVEVPR